MYINKIQGRQSFATAVAAQYQFHRMVLCTTTTRKSHISEINRHINLEQRCS
jgi:hypothetical protein